MRKLLCYLVLAVFMLLPAGMAHAKLSVSRFADTPGHWAETEIETAYTYGLMQGTGVNEHGVKVFSPQEKVNRFQLAAVIERAFHLNYGNMRFIREPVGSDYYGDVEDEAWYSRAVVWGAVNHIFAPTDYFRGKQEVPRIEVARSIYNAFSAQGIAVPVNEILPIYNDTQPLSQDDRNAMIFVSNTGIMKGNDKHFRPYDPITRAELARVLNQCVKLIEMNPVQPAPVPTFKLEVEEVKSESPLINIDLNIPVIKDMQNAELKAQLNNILAADARERQDAMVKQAQQDSDFILNEPYHTYQIVSRFNQYYTSPDILSFYVDYYTYTGGAHGMTDRIAYNFDLNTGRELVLGDLFAPDTDYTAVIDEKVRSLIAVDPEPYFEGELGFKGIKPDQCFYLENGCLIVYFLQYEIAPYAAGIRTFQVPLPDCRFTSYPPDNATVYSNSEYGFNFTLPDSWQGYSIMTGQWQGDGLGETLDEKGVLLSIRHPLWTAQNPRQDIPIMVFTLTQWDLVQGAQLAVSAAPIPPKELGRNSKYVLALPARYNYAFSSGYEEVERILENSPLETFEN